jgi:hypothetical protein
VDEEVIPRIRNAVSRVANELAIPGEMNHLLVDEIFRGVEGDRDALASRFADALYEEGETVQPGTCIRRLVLIQKLLKFKKVVNFEFVMQFLCAVEAEGATASKDLKNAAQPQVVGSKG